jgi:chromosome segregation ATPase
MRRDGRADVNSPDDWLGWITIVIAILGVSGSSFAWVSGQINKIRTEFHTRDDSIRVELQKDLDAARQKEGLDIGALRSEALTKLESLDQRFSKALHDAVGETTRTLASVQLQMNQMRDQSATKQELNAAEVRLVSTITEVKTETKTELAKLSIKVDKISEQLPAILAQLNHLAATIDKIVPLFGKGSLS